MTEPIEKVVENVDFEKVDDIVASPQEVVVESKWASETKSEEFKNVMDSLDTKVEDEVPHFPQEVVELFISEVMKNAGSGCNSPMDFANMLTKIYENYNNDSQKTRRAFLTKLVVGPKNFKTFRTNIPLWIVRSYVRVDGDNSSIVYAEKTYSKKAIASSPDFLTLLNSLANSLGSSVKVIGAKYGNIKDDSLTKNFEEVSDLFNSVDDIKPNSVIMFEFKRKISPEEVQAWKDNNPRQAKQIAKNEELNNKNKKEKSIVKKLVSTDPEMTAHIAQLESVDL